MKLTNLLLKKPTVLTQILILLVFSLETRAEILVPPERGDKLSAVVTVDVARNPNTGLYIYSYTVTNDSDSLQNASYFMVEIMPAIQVSNLTSPVGWEASVHSMEPMVGWGATKIEDVDIPPDWDGELLPSRYQIEPGETLSGFSFSSVAAPGDSAYYLRGWTHPPVVEGDFDELIEAGYSLNDMSPFAAFNAPVTSAMVSDIYSGNRRPAVDGFLGFLNIKNNSIVEKPMTVIGKFGINGELVEIPTFSAKLNGEDVTHLFLEDKLYGGDIVAVFEETNSPIRAGKNVLITSIDGYVPDTTRTASDVDRITFIVE